MKIVSHFVGSLTIQCLKLDGKTNKIIFSHNQLFLCLKVNAKNLNFQKPLDIKAFQYDIVCNGVELSSEQYKNHIPELMYKLFAVAGYDKKLVNEKFAGMINALSYGLLLMEE